MADVEASYDLDVSSFVANAVAAQEAAQSSLEGIAQQGTNTTEAMTGMGASAEVASAQLKEVGEVSENVGEQLKTLQSDIKKAVEATGVLILYEAMKRVAEVIGEWGEDAVKIQNLAEVLQLTTDQVQALNAAALESGVSNEQLSRSVERFYIMLVQAREGTATAIDKLHQLGITNEDIADKGFGTAEMLQVLHDRLTDTNTSLDEHQKMLATLGPRGALVSTALEKLDLSEEGVADKMKEVNALSTEQIAYWAHLSVEMKTATEALENFAKKVTGTTFEYIGVGLSKGADAARSFASAYGDALTSINTYMEASENKLDTFVSDIGTVFSKLGSSHPLANIKVIDPAQLQTTVDTAKGILSDFMGDVNIVNEGVIANNAAAAQKITTADLAAIKDRIVAERQGSAERLALTQEYYNATLQYYGNKAAEPVREAYAQMLGEQQSFNNKSMELNTQRTNEYLKADEDRLKTIDASMAMYDKELASARKDNEAMLESKREQVLGEIALQKQLFDASQQGNKSLDAPMQKAVGDKDFLDQQLAAWNSFYLAKMELVAQDVAEQKKAYSQMQAEATKSAEATIKIEADAAKQTQANWENALKPIGAAFDSTIMGMINRTETFHQAMLKLGSQLLDVFIKEETEEVIRWAAKEAAKTAATVSGVTVRTAAQETGSTTTLLTEGAAAIKFIGMEAYKAAAGAFAAMASIPYVGPALAVAASAAALTAVLGMTGAIKFEKGGLVPDDMMAQLHAGEAVLPRHLSEGIQRMINSGGGGGGAGGGGGVNLHVHSMDAKSFHEYVHTPAARTAIGSALKTAYNRGNVRSR